MSDTLKSPRATLRQLLVTVAITTISLPLFWLIVNVVQAIRGVDVNWMKYIVGAQGWIIICLLCLIGGMVSKALKERS